MCDRNAQYVIRVEDGIPLFQSCSQAVEDENGRRKGPCRSLLSSSLLPLICVTLGKPQLSTPQFLPLWNHRAGSGYLWAPSGRQPGNLLARPWESLGMETSIWWGCRGGRWVEGHFMLQVASPGSFETGWSGRKGAREQKIVLTCVNS